MCELHVNAYTGAELSTYYMQLRLLCATLRARGVYDLHEIERNHEYYVAAARAGEMTANQEFRRKYWVPIPVSLGPWNEKPARPDAH